MRVYVGMDVHRKRSQVAVVDDAGDEQRNRNVANDPAKLVPILGALAPGTPVAFEAAYGWGWLVELLEELGLEPHLVHPSRCKAIAAARLRTTRSMRARWRSCSAPICCPRPGSLPSRSATCAPCCATGPAWCARRPP
jgi:transposase